MKNILGTHRKAKITAIAIVSLLVLTSSAFPAYSPPVGPALLDPYSIPKYVNQLVAAIPVYVPNNVTRRGVVVRQDYEIEMTYFDQQILPPGTPLTPGATGLTHVWGYEGTVRTLDGTIVPNFHHSPSASFEATRGIPMRVKWINSIDEPSLMPVDPTLHWANPLNLPHPMPPYPTYPPGITAAQNSPVPLSTHVHGAEVFSGSDGGPEQWFTYNGIHGPDYYTRTKTQDNAAVYEYLNLQEATTLWYHDHALGMTRLNVMSGLAGYFFLREPPATSPITTVTATNFDQYLRQHFPPGVSEIPIAIQDRIFTADGQLHFPTNADNPDVHPYWTPEFFGNVIMVNGRVWPNLNITPGWYRLRLLEGSNARFYTLALKVLNADQLGIPNKVPFTVIGTEGGFLKAPATVNEITFGPGERYDVLVDFSNIPVGTKIIMTNTAGTPFPAQGAADPQGVGQIMQFSVEASSDNPGATAPTIPAQLNPTLTGNVWPTIPAGTNRRILTLTEVMGANGPLEALLNGLKWMSATTEFPANGDTEEWWIINLTGDSHPIHTHLTMVQLVSRRKLQAGTYLGDWLTLNSAGLMNGMLPFMMDYVPQELDPTPYLLGQASGPLGNEMGWKDTVLMHPGEVTIIRIRYAQQDGEAYPFDATGGPGYVWHCHIVDHEDNEMMRRFQVVPP